MTDAWGRVHNIVIVIRLDFNVRCCLSLDSLCDWRRRNRSLIRVILVVSSNKWSIIFEISCFGSSLTVWWLIYVLWLRRCAVGEGGERILTLRRVPDLSTPLDGTWVGTMLVSTSSRSPAMNSSSSAVAIGWHGDSSANWTKIKNASKGSFYLGLWGNHCTSIEVPWDAVVDFFLLISPLHAFSLQVCL